MNKFFEQKKGNPSNLDGRITAYAILDSMKGAPPEIKNNVKEGSGILAVTADCRVRHSMDDFLNSELGTNLKKGLDQVIQKLKDSGLFNEDINLESPKDESGMMQGMAELIPIMAKIVYFENIEEVLEQEGDVYSLGNFTDFNSASMCAQAFSLLYQSRYKEEEKKNAKKSIDELLLQIEREQQEDENFKDVKEELEKKLFGNYISAILYSKQNESEQAKAIERFRKFMDGYRFKEDVEEIISIGRGTKDQHQLRKFSLLLDKIVAFTKDDYNKLASIQIELKSL